MKVCRCCKIEKEDNCFRTIFDKRRNKNYTRLECIACQYVNTQKWYKKNKGTDRYAKMATKWARTYAEKIKNTPREEEIKVGVNARNRNRIANLDKLYVFEKLRRTTGLFTKDIPTELVEIKTKQLISCRTLKELRNSSKNQ